MNQYCPVCAEEVVPPSGNPANDFLIIEEFPELVYPPVTKSGWSGYKQDWTPRKILENELSKVGMVLGQFRIASVYPHHPPANGMPSEDCYNLGLDLVRNEMEGKKGIIILGSNLCKLMTNYDIKQVQGLSGVDFLLGVDAGDMPRVFLNNVRSIYLVGPGEFHVGLERFAKQIGAL